MKKLFVFFALLLSAPLAWSADYCSLGPSYNPYCAFMRAIGQCAPPNNPYENGMKALGGNDMQIDSWLNPMPEVVDFDVTVTFDAGTSLKRNVGALKLHTEMVGIGPSAELQCSLQVIPTK